MKLEIKTDKDGVCEYFKLDGKKFGQGIMGYEIHHNAGEKPVVILKVSADEFILDSENNKLYLDKLKEKSLLKKILKNIR